MNPDTELEAWRREWQSDAAIPPDLRRRVERQSRWMRITIAADILVTAGIGGAVLVLAVRAPQPGFVLLAAATWLFIASAWTFRLISSRGLWKPSAMDTAAFVDLLVKRCHARLAAAVFGAILYVCEIAFCVGWLYRYSGPLSAPLLVGLGLATLAFFAFVLWYRRRQRNELAWLATLRDA